MGFPASERQKEKIDIEKKKGENNDAGGHVIPTKRERERKREKGKKMGVTQ